MYVYTCRHRCIHTYPTPASIQQPPVDKIIHRYLHTCIYIYMYIHMFSYTLIRLTTAGQYNLGSELLNNTTPIAPIHTYIHTYIHIHAHLPVGLATAG